MNRRAERDEPGPLEAMGDEVLAIQANQDRAAFGVLYDRYVQRVHAYCYRRVVSVDLAADLTGTIFTKALAAIPRYRDDAISFRSWLFAIAHNVLIDEFRGRRPVLTLERAGHLVALEQSPEEHAVANERVRELQALLADLPPEQAQLLELRLAGLTDREIGDVLGRSPGAIRIAQFRAIRRLRNSLGIDTKELIDG
jgi:RNA polymerase sigma-70 factor (ECF subfamily)